MDLTKTSNRALSICTSLDASHISRLRRGERKLVREANYIQTMAAYFARRCVENYQQKALQQALRKTLDIPGDPAKTAEHICNWLFDDAPQETKSMDRFLDNLSKIDLEPSPKDETCIESTNWGSDSSEMSFHYGYEGKKTAVLGFLSLVKQSNQPGLLLLYSDEPMEWMTDDPWFLAQWSEMLKQVIMKGNRIRIIHNLNRNLDEMLEALTKWMPLYMTGAIEPYYYPKKRDGIFKRTLFICPHTASVTSTSIDTMADKGINILLRDARAIDALTEEYNAYFQLCKPLMRIFTSGDEEQYLSSMAEFEKETANAILEADYLSLATIPAPVAKSMFARMNSVRKKMLEEYYLKRREVLASNMANNSRLEIIHIPEIDEIKAGKAKPGFTGLTDFEELYYTPKEFKAHLENIVQLLQTHENYHLILKKRTSNEGYTLYVKEDLGAFVLKASRPNLIFAINESNMTAAFWDYLNAKLGNDHLSNRYKSETIGRLQAIIDEL